MKHYLFCLRHFNDIDNIAPAIYFLLERRQVRVTVLIYSLDYPYREDRSLKFLSLKFPDRFGVVWIGDFASYPYLVASSRLFRFAYRTMRRLLGHRFLHLALRQPGGSAEIVNGVGQIIERGNLPDTAVFDINRSHLIQGLVDVLRALGVSRVVALPVSPWANYNVLRQVDFIRIDAENFQRNHDYRVFDRIAQVDRFYSASVSRFFDLLGRPDPFKEKVSTLGSLRFSKAWLEIREEFLPAAPDAENPTGRPKILVLPSHPKNNSFWDEYLRTLSFLDQFRNYDITVRPHTRYGHGHKGLPRRFVLSQEQTSRLIAKSDIVLYWSTSVALEGFQRGKKMVCLDYLNGNPSVYSHFQAGVMCRSRDDLMAFLLSFPDHERHIPDNASGTSNLLSEVVHGGQGPEIIDRYLEFIEGESGSQP